MQTVNNVVGQIFVGKSSRETDTTRERYAVFNRLDRVATGWYWLIPSSSVKRNKVVAANIFGYELAVFRKNSGEVAALDAFCPHMGAHLAEGKVHGDQLRCFFHNWCFNDKGVCTDIPCQAGSPPKQASTRSWHVKEAFGLIWIWLGLGVPTCELPLPPELVPGGVDNIVYSLGNMFTKNCHPNVVMVNAIDEQHFHTVHNLPGHILSMQPRATSPTHIEFQNQGSVPVDNFAGQLLARLYRNALTYNLDYWYGSTGTVTLGPDCLHMYLMFTLRMTSCGKTEGYAIAFAKKPTILWQALITPVILFITKLAGIYFAKGDTRVFNTIKFDFKTPIAADHAVLAFIQHLDKQVPFARMSDA